MQITNRKLLAIALAATLAAPLALAGDPQKKPTSGKATTTQTTTTKTPTTSATDAVSTQTTARETGRMAESPIHSGQTVSAGATGGSAAGSNPGKGNWWADADIDGDGKLSAAEAKANAGVDARFGTIDADGDGFITNEEYRKFFTASQSQGELHAQAHSAVVTRDVWTKLDTNDDGKLSSSEVSGNATINGAFSAMDSNGDGFVTQAEYTAYAKTNL
jgi:hypothetical protein